jgi:hypothetical protein
MVVRSYLGLTSEQLACPSGRPQQRLNWRGHGRFANQNRFAVGGRIAPKVLIAITYFIVIKPSTVAGGGKMAQNGRFENDRRFSI